MCCLTRTQRVRVEKLFKRKPLRFASSKCFLHGPAGAIQKIVWE